MVTRRCGTRSWLPRRRLRLRLTLLYGVLFLASGAALLGLTYLLVAGGDPVEVTTSQLAGPGGAAPLPPLRDETAELRAQAQQQRAAQLRRLLVSSGLALAVMTVVSAGLGWLVAGRVLRPLRTMAVRTRRISQHNLDQRLALTGPRDELTNLGDTIDGLLARLESAFTAHRRFVANASHELRTPLAMMRTSLDVAVAKPGPHPPQLLALERKLREGLVRIEQLLEELLTLARAQHGVPPRQTMVCLAEIMTEALHRHHDAVVAADLTVVRRLDPASLRASATLLERIGENLLDNAIRYNEPGGWISVETSAERGAARLAVANGGAQLDPSTVGELTQPFRRVSGERGDPATGLGLGLSIVEAIVIAHRGELVLRARPEGGVSALVTLPSTEDTMAGGATR